MTNQDGLEPLEADSPDLGTIQLSTTVSYLSSSGFGTFFLARDETARDRPERVVQVIPKAAVDQVTWKGDEEGRLLWLSQGKVPAHVGLVPIGGVVSNEDSDSVAVVYCQDQDTFTRGISLESLVEDDRGGYGIESLLSLGNSLFSTLVYLHEHGLLHYNLRPSCVLTEKKESKNACWWFLAPGIRFNSSSLSDEDRSIYPLVASCRRPFPTYLNFDEYDEDAEVGAAKRLLLWALDSLPEFDSLWNELKVRVEGNTRSSEGNGDRDARHANLRMNLEDFLTGCRLVFQSLRLESATSGLKMLEGLAGVWADLIDSPKRGHLRSDFVRNRLGEVVSGIKIPVRGVAEYRSLVPGTITNGSEPSLVSIQGIDLEPCSVFYLRRSEAKNLEFKEAFPFAEIPSSPEGAGCDSAAAAIKEGLAVLFPIDSGNDTPASLERVVPPLHPGCYRIFSTGEGDTGLTLSVEQETTVTVPHCVFKTIQPLVIEDGSKDAVVTLTGENLHESGVVHLEKDGALIALPDGSRYVRLRRTEESKDEPNRLSRVIPVLGPGVYRLVHERTRTALCFEVAARKPAFGGIEPKQVCSESGFSLHVVGQNLPSTAIYGLVDEQGQPAISADGRAVSLTRALVPGSTEWVDLVCESGVRPGAYSLMCADAPTGLTVQVLPRVDSSLPRRLYTRGKCPPLQLVGRAFSDHSHYSLRAEDGRNEVDFEELESTEDGVQLVLPRNAPADRYEVLIDGVETGASVKVARFSRTTNSILAVVVLMFFALGGVAGVPYLFRSEYQEVAPSVLHFVEGDGQVITAKGIEVYGKNLRTRGNYGLVADGEVLVSLVPDRVDRDGERLSFSRLYKIEEKWKGREAELCVLTHGGKIKEATGLTVELQPFKSRVASMSGDAVIFDGERYVRAAEGMGGSLEIQLSGKGLGITSKGSFDLEPPMSGLTVASCNEMEILLTVDSPEDLDTEQDYELIFHPEPSSNVSLGKLRVHEPVGFQSVSLLPQDENDRRTISFFNRDETLFLTPLSTRIDSVSGTEFRFVSEDPASSSEPWAARSSLKGDQIALEFAAVSDLGDRASYMLEFRDAGKDWKRAQISVAVCPVPRFERFQESQGGIPLRGWVGLTHEKEPIVTKIRGRGLEDVFRARLLPVPEESSEGDWFVVPMETLAVAVSPGRDDQGTYWELSIPNDRSLIGRTYQLAYSSSVSGEWMEPDGVYVSLFDGAGVDALMNLIHESDEHLAKGRPDQAQVTAATTLSSQHQGAWWSALRTGMADSLDRDRMRFIQGFVSWAWSGQQGTVSKGLISSFENEVFRAAGGALVSAETLPLASFVPPIEFSVPDFRRETPDRTTDDWITDYLLGYEAYLDVVTNRRLERFDNASRSLQSLSGQFPSARYYSWDLELYGAVHRWRRIPEKIKSVIDELPEISDSDPRLLWAFHQFYALRGRIWWTARGGKDLNLSRDILDGAERLAGVQPYLCALLIEQSINGSTAEFQEDEEAFLRRVFDSAVSSLDDQVAVALKGRLK